MNDLSCLKKYVHLLNQWKSNDNDFLTEMILPCWNWIRAPSWTTALEWLVFRRLERSLHMGHRVTSPAGATFIVMSLCPHRSSCLCTSLQGFIGVENECDLDSNRCRCCLKFEQWLTLTIAHLHSLPVLGSYICCIHVLLSSSVLSVSQLMALCLISCSRPCCLWWSTVCAVAATGGASTSRAPWSVQEETSYLDAMCVRQQQKKKSNSYLSELNYLLWTRSAALCCAPVSLSGRLWRSSELSGSGW